MTKLHNRFLLAGIGAVLLVAILFLWSAAGPESGESRSGTGPAASGETDLQWEVPDFTAVDQNGKPFGLSDLKGKVWLADFVFTHCTTVCPPMTANMARLQQRLKQAGVDVEIVSFSVDPERDRPAVLRDFGRRHGADFSNWHFLTGYSFETIQRLSRDAFKAEVRMDPGSDQVVHGTSFYLVDASGVIRKRYSGLQPDEEQILRDIQALQAK